MRSLATWRAAFVAAGVACVAVGLWELLDRLPHAVVRVAAWSVGPVLVHDGLLAPVAVALFWAGARVLPRPVWAPLVTGLLVSAGLLGVAWTLVTRPGALATNPSLLDRDYRLGLLAALGVVWAGVGVWGAVALRRAGGVRADPAGWSRGWSRSASSQSGLE